MPPALDRIRKTRGPFKSDDDLLLAAFYDDTHYGALKEAGPIRTEYPLMETPLLTLVKELSLRPSIKSFRLQQSWDPALKDPSNGTTPAAGGAVRAPAGHVERTSEH